MIRPTGTGTGEVQDYTTVPESAQTRALSMHADYLRTASAIVGVEVEYMHEHVREMDLANRTLAKGRNDVPSLLEELAYARGLAWTDIAEVADVSVSAVRKWRKGGDASPDSRSRLARFAALLDMLEEKGNIQSPANWMEMELPLGPGYHVRPLDLYLSGHGVALLDIAEERGRIEHLLDYIQPRWRENRSQFEVFDDSDGLRSIRVRVQ
jgi:transcriptional regulator with XRE-family HTH domain